MNRFLLPLSLTASLAACDVVAPRPSVRSVTPEKDATNVRLDTTVQAQLDLQNGAVNLITLSSESAVLTGPDGPVAATPTLEGTNLVLDPLEDLAADTTYTFSVTSSLQLESGTGFTPFSSSFTTGTEGGAEPLELVMRNAIGLPSETRMVLSKVGNLSGDACYGQPEGCNPNRWQDMVFYDAGTLTLENPSASPLTVTLTSEPATLFSLSASTVTLAPGDTEDITVTFLGNDLTDKGIYPASIIATSSTQSTSFDVVGLYQQRPEGSGELGLGRIMEAFGYQTDFGAASSGFLTTDEATSPKAGDEVRSEYWRAANPGSPVKATQIAAFQPCCEALPTIVDFELFAQGSSSYFARLPYDTDYSQSVFPSSENGKVPNSLSVKTGATFRFDIAGYSSIPKNGYLGIRFWPLVNEEGQPIANSYIVAQDYARGPCGSGETTEDGISLGSNCDYNDHIFLVQNITPVSPY